MDMVGNTSVEINEPLLNANEVKRLLKCSLPLIYKMAQQRQIPCIRWKCPGQGQKKPRTIVRFKREDVFKFIEDHYQTT